MAAQHVGNVRLRYAKAPGSFCLVQAFVLQGSRDLVNELGLEGVLVGVLDAKFGIDVTRALGDAFVRHGTTVALRSRCVSRRVAASTPRQSACARRVPTD